MADNTTTSYLSGILGKAKSIQERLDASQKKTNQLVKQQADTNVVYQPRKASTLYTESSRQNTRTSPYQSLINTAKTYDQFAYGSTEAAKKPLGYLGKLTSENTSKISKLDESTGKLQGWVDQLNAINRMGYDVRAAARDAVYAEIKSYGMDSNIVGSFNNWKQAQTNRNALLKTKYTNENLGISSYLNKTATKEQLASADWSGFTKLQEQIDDMKAKRQIYIDTYRSTGDATALNFINQYSDSIDKGITALGKELPAVLTSASSLASTKKGIQQSTLDTLEQMKLGKLSQEGKLKSLTQTEQAPNTMKQQILNRLAKVNKLSGSPSVVRPTPISQTRPA